MSVAQASSGTLTSNSAGSYVASPYTHATFTVSAGSNLVLYVAVLFDDTSVSGVAANWDSAGTPQAMTEIKAVTNSGTQLKLFRLVNPTTGNRTLSVSWSGGIAPIAVGLSAYSDAHQTLTEIDIVSGSGTGTAITTGAVPSDTGHATLGIAGTCDIGSGAVAFSSTDTQTEEYRTSTNTQTAVAGSFASGGSSNTHSWTANSSEPWCAIGVHIADTAYTPPPVFTVKGPFRIPF